MERIRNLISPRARRKKLDLGLGADGLAVSPTPKTFGVALHDLMLREPPNAIVPQAVAKICEYIYKFGLDQVGLFRISGSVRVVEKMRMQFDLTGDVNLEEENDVAATAGLLKVFLRDLPEMLIPAALTSRFFSVVKDSTFKLNEKLEMMRNSLRSLPEENLQLLKYICSLLVVVADCEEENKMSAFTLAILFGPNIFTYQVTSGLEGMRDMDTSKDVMQLFISNYHFLFAERGDPSPKEFWERCCDKKKCPPERPPPPKLVSQSPVPSTESVASSNASQDSLTTSVSSSAFGDFRPVPSPRKIKSTSDCQLSYVTSSATRSDDDEHKMTLSFHSHSDSVPLFSPRDEIDHSRSHSPFGLESDTHSMIDSPMVTARTNEFVEKTIVETISEHIFGALDINQNSGTQSPKSPSPTKAFQDDLDTGHGGHISSNPVDIPAAKPRTSLAWKKHAPQSSSAKENVNGNSDALSFDELQSSELLVGVKRTPGPLRRSPSLKHRHSWEGSGGESPSVPDGDGKQNHFQYWEGRSGDHQSQNTDPSLENENRKDVLIIHEVEDKGEKVDAVVVEQKIKSRRSYADVVNGWTEQTSEEKAKEEDLEPQFQTQTSPTVTTKDDRVESPPATTALTLLIPPLDLSTLHQHVDGVDARPVSSEQISSQAWINLAAPADQNAPVLSPRSNKMKKRNGVSSNTDIPPSPPIHQDVYKKHSDDECSYKLRQLTKKIQGLKKKIKAFEENFENIHGYRPSQGERAAQPEVKKFMNELSKARKDLKILKENTEKTNRSRHNSGASSSGQEFSPPVIPSVANTLDEISHGLKERRKETDRPEDIILMTRDQIQQEKLDVQKVLLRFESLHGRPSTKEDKDLMRPLYDRYRQIKRILAKPASPRNSLELMTVPEEHIMEIPRTFNRAPIHVPTAFGAEEDNNTLNSPELGTVDCFGIVTRDFSRLGTMKDHLVLHDIDLPPDRELNNKVAEEEEDGVDRNRMDEEKDSKGDAHLHELSLSDLHIEIETTRKEKKKLRKVLREFEEDFLIQHGRKVQKEDRHPLQNEYSNYKKVKARMRLLEALVLKQHE